MFSTQYANVFEGDEAWQQLPTSENKTYQWNNNSTYIQNPPFFLQNELNNENSKALHDISGAQILAILGDSITTDHISPAGDIAEKSPAGAYLKKNNVSKEDFNSYGSRRGNHEVMMRGTFASPRIKNEMCSGVEGGYTRYIPTGEQTFIYDAAMLYQQENIPLVVFAGKEYGTGSSRDWAAKGARLLGVKAVIAESFERIHRSNLVGMGVLPLQFIKDTRKSLALDGSEKISIEGVAQLKVGSKLTLRLVKNQTEMTCEVLCRIDTDDELQYFKNGGILQYVMKQLADNDNQERIIEKGV